MYTDITLRLQQWNWVGVPGNREDQIPRPELQYSFADAPDKKSLNYLCCDGNYQRDMGPSSLRHQYWTHCHSKQMGVIDNTQCIVLHNV